MFSLQMMEMSERLKGLKKLRNGILLPDAEADLPPAFDHCTLSTFYQLLSGVLLLNLTLHNGPTVN